MKKLVIVMVLLIMLMNLSFAADGFYRLTHNDHDALVIGEIQAVNDGSIVVTVEKQIISDMDLTVEQPIAQIDLVGKTITIHEAGHFSLFELDSTMAPIPSAGDLVLVSVNQDGVNFRKMWGLYKLAVQEDRYQVLTSDIGSEYYKMDAAALEVFINSDGMINEFSFNGDTKEVYSGDQLIYDGEVIVEETVEDITEEKKTDQLTEEQLSTESGEALDVFNQSYIMIIIAILMAIGILIFRFFNKE